MRTGYIIAVFACLGSAAAAAAASADYYLQIKGVAAEGGYTFLDVVSTGDLDGDGLADEAVVRLQCVGADIQTAEYSIKSPRDAASGQASGKRTHKPVTFVKEWGATTPQLAKVRPGYNVKQNNGARAAATGDGWTAISLSDASSLCADSTAALKATKTRSNIQNN